MGALYANGEGVPQDNVKAYKWIDLAEADSKPGGSTNKLAAHSISDIAARMTPAQISEASREAAAWLHLPASLADFWHAAHRGNSVAQSNLGIMYYKGHGVQQSYAEALKWFRLSARRGDAAAQSNLGIMYANGQGVPKNYTKAVKWI
ncbi:Sel1 domain protein repeat-containing protein, partial [mine drainage metagenome]